MQSTCLYLYYHTVCFLQETENLQDTIFDSSQNKLQIGTYVSARLLKTGGCSSSFNNP